MPLLSVVFSSRDLARRFLLWSWFGSLWMLLESINFVRMSMNERTVFASWESSGGVEEVTEPVSCTLTLAIQLLRRLGRKSNVKSSSHDRESLRLP